MSRDTTVSNKETIKNQLHVLAVAEGFFQSGVLFALLRLNVFERIGEGVRSTEELAGELDARPDTLARLLNAGVMLKLLERSSDGRYKVAAACRSTLLPSSGETYLGNWIRLQSEFYDGMSRLDEAVLKSAPTIAPETYLGGDPERTRQYILAMHNYAAVRGKELAHYLDTSECESILDLGCGPGTFAFHLGMKNPELRLYLADFPEILEVAQQVQARYYLQNEVNYLPLDAAKDKIPGAYDMILASNMLHCFEKPVRDNLIARLFGALNAGGSLVVQAQYLNADRTSGRWAVYVDLNLLVTTEKGRNHTVDETKQWLHDAGFERIEYCPMSIYGANSFVRGYKPL